MNEQSYKFDIPKQSLSIIKVIGVGGGGSNAVNHMYNQGIQDVEFVICNTDKQALASSPVPNKLQIGTNLTEGLGAGANPERGKDAALESKEEIRDLLSENTKMVFITAGMGGGTGTGAAPVIAQVSRELGILTVGIVTAPFGFEGRKKIKAAEAGIEAMKEHCDTLLVISNDRLREVFGNLSLTNAFNKADNVLTTAAKSIAEIITVEGYVNVDFEDVKTVMQNSGGAVMGSAIAEGDGRAIRAAEEAISSPLLNNKNIHGAQRILLMIVSGEQEISMDELSEVTDYIQDKAGEGADLIFGNSIDPELGSSIRVTVIATGFQAETTLDPKDQKRVIDLESNRQINLFEKGDERKDSKSDNFSAGKTYQFEMPENQQREDEQEEEEDYLNQIRSKYQIVDSDELDERRDPSSDIALKRKLLEERANERRNSLNNLRMGNLEENEFKERLEIPAYKRRNVRLAEIPHSSEKNISRLNLNDDNRILGNNRFLHDNVD